MTPRLPAGRWALAGLAAIALSLAARDADAEIHRAAVVVGSNAGSDLRPPLRYAESDAAKVARVLLELGGFSRADVYLLRGRDGETLRQALDSVKRKVTAWRAAEPGARVEIVFYFSGHSDGLALELGADRLQFSDLKGWADHSGADVRLLIVDSCKSGSLLASKGGSLGPGFEIQMADSLSSTGEALLTSSAADESALESEEIRGSFFSNNLVSGLRGAADVSGDGRVTLGEAYHYAFSHTLSATSRTIYGPQHAGYDFRLSGHGDLVLTEVSHPTAALELPAGYDRVLVSSAAHGVVAEAHRGAGRRIALTPGRYDLQAWHKREQFRGSVEVGAGAVRAVGAGELIAWNGMPAATKGGDLDAGGTAATLTSAPPSPDEAPDEASDEAPARVALGLALGAGQSMDGSNASFAARTELGSARPSGFQVALVGTLGGEMSFAASVGYRLGREVRLEGARFRLEAGLEAGGGVVLWPATSQAGGGVAPVVLAAPTLGLKVPVRPWVALAVTAQYALAMTMRSEEAFTAAVPRAFAGLQTTF